MAVVSSHDKIGFLRWFLTSQTLKKRQCVWILSYLMTDEQRLNKVHFVEDAKNTPLGIKMSAYGTNDTAFEAYYGSVTITDVDAFLEDLKDGKYDASDFYIEIIFPFQYHTQEWLAALEKPFDEEQQLSIRYGGEAEALVTYMEKQFKIKLLKDKIDESLRLYDKDKFLEYTNELKTLNNNEQR